MMNEVENFMRKAFPEEMERRDNSQCPFCGKSIDPEKDFKDNLSRKEFEISGMCQACQDDFFD